jgi:hypothetical protein
VLQAFDRTCANVHLRLSHSSRVASSDSGIYARSVSTSCRRARNRLRTPSGRLSPPGWRYAPVGSQGTAPGSSRKGELSVSTDTVRSFELLQGGQLSRAQKNEARLFCLNIVRNPAYREALLRDAIARKLPPPIELEILRHAWGKPPDRLEVGRPGDFAELEELSSEQLVERAQGVISLLRSPELAVVAGISEAEAKTQTDNALAARIRKAERLSAREIAERVAAERS